MLYWPTHTCTHNHNCTPTPKPLPTPTPTPTPSPMPTPTPTTTHLHRHHQFGPAQDIQAVEDAKQMLARKKNKQLPASFVKVVQMRSARA